MTADTLLWIAAVGFFAVCAALLVGHRGSAASRRTLAGIVAGIAGSGALVAASFVTGGGVLAWIGLVVWLALVAYVVLVVRRVRRTERARSAHSEGRP